MSSKEIQVRSSCVHSWNNEWSKKKLASATRTYEGIPRMPVRDPRRRRVPRYWMARPDAGPEPSPTTMPLSTNLSTWGQASHRARQNNIHMIQASTSWWNSGESPHRELGGVEEADDVGVRGGRAGHSTSPATAAHGGRCDVADAAGAWARAEPRRRGAHACPGNGVHGWAGASACWPSELDSCIHWMDGTLTKRIRGAKQVQHQPIVLVLLRPHMLGCGVTDSSLRYKYVH